MCNRCYEKIDVDDDDIGTYVMKRGRARGNTCSRKVKMCII